VAKVCNNYYQFKGWPSVFAASRGAPAAVRPGRFGVSQPAAWRATARLRPSGRSAKTVHSRPRETPGRRARDPVAVGPWRGAGGGDARGNHRCFDRRPGCGVDPGGAAAWGRGARGGSAETGAGLAKDVGTRGSWGQDGPGPGKPSSATNLASHSARTHQHWGASGSRRWWQGRLLAPGQPRTGRTAATPVGDRRP